MCGRFATYKNVKRLNKIFELNNKNLNIPPSYNISPGNEVNILINYEYQNYYLPTHWGYSFTNNNTEKKQILINSRIETINSKLLFKDSFLKRKCIIPSNGYYEWSNNGSEKKPYFVKLGDGELIYFAGIWRKENHKNDKKRVFSIITKEANKTINKIHHRMPITLNTNNALEYLSDKKNQLSFDDFEEPDLSFYEVSKYVNNPKNNDEKCIIPNI